mgnify:CR=1 FL=1
MVVDLKFILDYATEIINTFFLSNLREGNPVTMLISGGLELAVGKRIWW